MLLYRLIFTTSKFGVTKMKSTKFNSKHIRHLQRKKGQTLVEYALILAFISVVAISVLITLGKQVKTVFSTISSQLAYAGSSH